MTTTPTSTILGYPRIGPNRELKKALEGYWSGKLTAQTLAETGDAIRAAAWAALEEAGLDEIPSNTFSYYDHVLDTTVAVGAIPTRFRDLGLSELDTYFAMARGTDQLSPLELTKWFDTNYHYLVPELTPETSFAPNPTKAVAEFAAAHSLGIITRPVLVGPLTFLLLAKPGVDAPSRFRPLDLLDPLVECYAELLRSLAEAGADWVQLDEPALACDRTDEELAMAGRAYARLGELTNRPRLLVASYFGELGPALPVLLGAPIEGIGVDLITGAGDLRLLMESGRLDGRRIVAGLVDGRNVWRSDLGAALESAQSLQSVTDDLVISTSCSLLHVPADLAAETGLDPRLRAHLAFAREKVAEVVTLTRAVAGNAEAVRETAKSSAAVAQWRDSDWRRNGAVRERLAELTEDQRRRVSYAARIAAQHDLNLPPLATTTIGSFPQTSAVRTARADFRAGRIDEAAYIAQMKAEIASVIALQEELGLDVLVHGEPERNDMVQYFAESLAGFAATTYGWVQSYGSRCVRPPILFGDVSRPAPITVDWATYAQSLTTRPVKGMLTGPVTILAWSFVRDDQSLAQTADQVALALRDETRDLESAGIRIIQVDEPALRELLPPRARQRPAYLAWAVGAFRAATSGIGDSTQVHTHLCYSEFGEVLGAINDLDADVTSIEASRSRMEIVHELANFGRGIGPGVYDIHSPRVPAVAEVIEALRLASKAIPAQRLWVNPDCGLKTRGYAEVRPALAALVAAARQVRTEDYAT